MPPPSYVRRAHGSLVGRVGEVRHVTGALERARLVTLLGPGGVGKTALAAEIAHELEPEHARVLFVELIDADRPDDVARLVSDAVTDEAFPSIAAVAAALALAPVLLVIDNCEHLVDAVAAVVGELLGATTELRVLTTSRRPLNIAPEIVVPLAPLPVPEPTGDPAQLVAVPAVALFLERVRQAVPSFELDEPVAATVAQICASSDGLPLVLELAAALVRSRPLDEILRAMTEAPASLASPRRDLPQHQRTVASSLEWSRRFLEPDDARLLDRLAVFRGGFTGAAARALDPAGSGAGLERLVDHSLVAFDVHAARYRLLEVVRLDAERRMAGDERDDAERAHLQWCLEIVSVIEAGRFDPDPDNHYRRHQFELPNLQIAAQRALRHGNLPRYWSVVGPIAVWWVHYVPPDDVELWTSACAGDALPAAWRANITAALAFYWSHRGDHHQAVELARQAVPRHQAAADRIGALVALLAVGNAQLALDHVASAAETYEQVLARSLDAGAPYPQLLARLALARLDPDGPAARTHLAAALSLAELGFGSLEAVTHTELALAALRNGDLRAARRSSDEGLRRARAGGYAEVVASVLCGDGEIALAEGDRARARTALLEVRALSRASAHLGLLQRSEAGLAAVAAAGGDDLAWEVPEVLTDRELAVARLLRGDLTHREIADELYIAPSTVKSHTKSIYRKLGVSKRSHAITRAAELGLFGR